MPTDPAALAASGVDTGWLPLAACPQWPFSASAVSFSWAMACGALGVADALSRRWRPKLVADPLGRLERAA